MFQSTGSRLAVAGVILSLQIYIFFFELLIFSSRARQAPRYTPLRQLIWPLTIALIITIVIPIAFANAGSYIDRATEQCSDSIDGDIAGEGAQIAVWVQVGVLLVISLLGSFHTSATGSKEIGAGLALTHVSLSIAVLAQMSLGTLTSVDAVVGAMILDAQNVGLSIQLAAKETLASRWQVMLVVLVQTLGIILIPVLIANFTHGAFSSRDCRCLEVFWWAWISSCDSSMREMYVFWIYYACRSVCFCQTSFHSLYNTSKFDVAEKSSRAKTNAMDGDAEEYAGLLHETEQQDCTNNSNSNEADEAQRNPQEVMAKIDKYTSRGIKLRRVTHIYHHDGNQFGSFGEYPATVTLMFMVYGAFSLASMGTVQTTVTSFHLNPPSPIDSVGQVISLIVAAATVGRAIWLFFMLYRKEARSRKRNFVSPLRWKIAKDSLLTGSSLFPAMDSPRPGAVSHYVPWSPLSHDPVSLPLGTLLEEPLDPKSRIGAGNFEPEGINHSLIQNLTMTSSRVTGLVREQRKENYSIKSLVTSSFDPKSAPFESYIAREVQNPLFKANGALPVYMVTGIKVAEGLKARSEHTSRRIFTRQTFREQQQKSFGEDQEILFAYRLHTFRWCSSKEVFIIDGKYLVNDDW